MLYPSSSNKYEMFETFPLLELQMVQLATFSCKMAMVTNGYLKLDAFGRKMTIRNEILTILAFNSCKICLRPGAPDFFFASTKVTTLFHGFRHKKIMALICKYMQF
jgi:hypothetical protein